MTPKLVSTNKINLQLKLIYFRGNEENRPFSKTRFLYQTIKMKLIESDEKGDNLFNVETKISVDLKHEYQNGKAEGVKVNEKFNLLY